MTAPTRFTHAPIRHLYRVPFPSLYIQGNGTVDQHNSRSCSSAFGAATSAENDTMADRLRCISSQPDCHWLHIRMNSLCLRLPSEK